ncbi:hypothetical protein Mal4_31240 [Maioricimonas rarisocia]|uniref:Uncharacterized protein n=1 Tax=Maioricimonas rarisocia TaxID=2528026 RepID=A0A517Z8J9_9PLAN|nr:hypothetical protein [Maioricimonas rarisocia]QDU38794.1 hypothetical protein Mal4_31240 [Maioricimonas rarisocia]
MDALAVSPHETRSSLVDGTVADSFHVCSLDGLVVLKLIGFVEREQARILEVDERSARLRVGQTWWERLWNGGPTSQAVEVRLAFTPALEDEVGPRGNQAPHARVDVQLVPVGRGRVTESFRSHAHELLRRLRWHFIANC